MHKIIKTNLTEEEFRKIIRDEVRAVINEDPALVAGTEQEGFINIDQAAEFLKVAKQTLYTRTSEGTIPFTKKGKRLLFKKTELLGWLTVPSIVSVSVQLIDQDEMAILLECESAAHAVKLDQMLDDYSIKWGVEIPGRGALTLRSPAIGSYQKDVALETLPRLDTASQLATAYRKENGLLDPIERPRAINRVFR